MRYVWQFLVTCSVLIGLFLAGEYYRSYICQLPLERPVRFWSLATFVTTVGSFFMMARHAWLIGGILILVTAFNLTSAVLSRAVTTRP